MLSETFIEFKELINYEKSIYPSEIIDYQIKQFIWAYISKHYGKGLHNNDIEYSKKFKSKKNLTINLNISLILKIFNIKKLSRYVYERLYFRVHMIKNFSAFKKSHNKFKKIFK